MGPPVEDDLEPLFGNTAGLSSADNKSLRAFYRRSLQPTQFLSPPLARELTELTRRLGRRVGLLIDRAGKVEKVVVGDAHRVFLPDLGPRRAGAARFRGVRLVLSSLRPEGVTQEDLTDLVLLQLDAVIVVFAEPEGLPGPIHYAHLLPPPEDDGEAASSEDAWRVERVPSVHQWEDDWQAFIRDLEGQFTRSPHLSRVDGREGALLVGLTLGNPRKARRAMTELERLSDTAGFAIRDVILQNRNKIDGRTYIGSGKLQELVIHAMHLGAEALVFDRELSPSQLRNIADRTELKVLDRTQIILDIFAQHATSREGKLQVEIAQHRYRMPRLAILRTAMSRLTGGVGGRGPGETKLEINRRRAEERLTRLERELGKLSKNRATRRKRRQKADIPVASIVGYTNAGKSTLLNRLTRSEVLVEDQLFATLDPTTRRLRFPEEREIVITDTVGFIEDLPKTLVSAFKSTLEELEEADLLLHVLDASDEDVRAQLRAVQEVLSDLDLQDTMVLRVWNKAEVAEPDALRGLIDEYGGIAVSAITGQGCEDLLEALEQHLFRARAARDATRSDDGDLAAP